MTGVNAYTDLLYEERDGIATITINRPDKLNAFRGKTCDELIDALNRAAWNTRIGVIVLTGAGRGFCAGLDLTEGASPPSARGLGRAQAGYEQLLAAQRERVSAHRATL